jgi:DNA modification methylase
MASHRIIQGDCIEGLRTLPDASVHCCVTSPPYWGLRDYGHEGQIGLEATPEAYVARMVEVFREVRRVLRDDGTCWVNLGDSYAASGLMNLGSQKGLAAARERYDGIPRNAANDSRMNGEAGSVSRSLPPGLKPKDLVGIPWRVAFALQADGWWLRQDIIWHKPSCMPESVRDRCTKAHEYVFLLAKSERYYYDAFEIAEKAKNPRGFKYEGGWEDMREHVEPELRVQAGNCRTENGTVPHFASGHGEFRNRRSVWTITTKPYSGAHFAVMPPDLVEPCIKAGCPEGGTVLDPFAGSGTTLAVAAELGRSGIGCELNPEYIQLAEQRIAKSKAKMPLFVA